MSSALVTLQATSPTTNNRNRALPHPHHHYKAPPKVGLFRYPRILPSYHLITYQYELSWLSNKKHLSFPGPLRLIVNPDCPNSAIIDTRQHEGMSFSLLELTYSSLSCLVSKRLIAIYPTPHPNNKSSPGVNSTPQRSQFSLFGRTNSGGRDR